MSAGDWKELYKACLDGNLELVQYHIRNGVDPNYQHPEILSTPLVASLIEGHENISVFLLDHGARPDLVSEFDGMTGYQAAEKFKRTEILEKLRRDYPTENSKPNQAWWKKLVIQLRRS
jgi:uncharacterized protein